MDYGKPKAVGLLILHNSFTRSVHSRVGIPEEVLTDQGTQFMAECVQEVSRLLAIKGLTSTPYHPICNGLVERWNRTLNSMLKSRGFVKTSRSSGTD